MQKGDNGNEEFEYEETTKDPGSRKSYDESRHRNICDPRRRTDSDG